MRNVTFLALLCAAVALRSDDDARHANASETPGESLAGQASLESVHQEVEVVAHQNQEETAADSSHTCCCHYESYGKRTCGRKAKSIMYQYTYRGLSDCTFDPRVCEALPGWISVTLGKSAKPAACTSYNGKTRTSSCAGDASYLLQADVRAHKAKDSSHRSHDLNLQVGSGTSDPTVDGVMAAFNAMSTNGAAIDIDQGSSWPSKYKSYFLPYTYHIEGIQRFRPSLAGGSSYLALSGSGADANIFIAEIPSRASGPGPITGGTSVPTGSITRVLDIDTFYTHAGGFQIQGNLLAVGVEKGCNAMNRMIPKGLPGACEKASRVLFFDVSDPSNPVKLNTYIDRPGTTAGAVGLLKQESGKWLVLAGGTDSNELDLYVQNDDGSFHKAAHWSKNELVTAVGVSGGYKSYQTLNLVLQKDGAIYMVGTTRSPTMIGRDYFDLFKVQPSGGGRATITFVASKAVRSRGADFSAAGAIYVDTSTNMIGYGSSWLPGTGTSNPVVPGNTIHVNEFV